MSRLPGGFLPVRFFFVMAGVPFAITAGIRAEGGSLAEGSAAPAGGVVAGRLTVRPLLENLQPSPNAYLTLWREESSGEEIDPRDETWTDRNDGGVWVRQRSAHPNDGRHGRGSKAFEFSELPPGRYCVTAASYRPEEPTPDPTPFGISEPVLLGVDAAGEEIEVIMRGGRSLTVRVLDEQTGEPISRMGLRLTNSRGVPIVHGHGSGNFFERSSETGEVFFRNLPADTYHVDILGKRECLNNFVRYDPVLDSLRIKLTEQDESPRTLTFNAPPRRLSQAEIDKQFPFSVFGRVTDNEGKPLADVTVQAATGWGTLLGGSSVKTNKEGEYRLYFGPGVLMMETPRGVGTQAALISVRKPGWFETNLNRQGNLLMSDADPETMRETFELEGRVWDRTSIDQVVFPNQDREVNFVMGPAATIAGKLLSNGGRELEEEAIFLTGEQLPPGHSVMRSLRTGEDGEFVIEEVPVGYRWRFGIRVGSTWQKVKTKAFEISRPGLHRGALDLLSTEGPDGEVTLRWQYEPQEP